jgi:hypothetical protein
MSEVEQRREVAQRRHAHDAAGKPDAARAAKVRRNAWLLAALAVFVYLGYIAWMFMRANGG